MIFALRLEFNKLNFPKEKPKFQNRIFSFQNNSILPLLNQYIFNSKHLLFRLVKERRNTLIIMHGVIYLCQSFNVLRVSLRGEGWWHLYPRGVWKHEFSGRYDEWSVPLALNGPRPRRRESAPFVEPCLGTNLKLNYAALFGMSM